ncbi:MAG: glycosyltransferase family 2 protein [Lentisphaerae bacterium]|nr:glycosyltransferase family 2 protein [Lentisphaerota bacterium]
MCCNSSVSVIIPAYNHENYVQDTLKSVIAQTYQNIELIVVDDGSKDSTWQKIQEMRGICEKRFSRVHFETKANEGICKTLNRLLDLANGEYVYPLASDDQVKPHAIEKELNFLKDHPDYALCTGDSEFIDAQGKIAYWDKQRNLIYEDNPSVYHTFGEYSECNIQYFDFYSNDFGSYLMLSKSNHVPNGYLIRKSIFDKFGRFTPEAPLEDWYLMLQISKYAKMKYFDEVLFSYRWHVANTAQNIAKMEAMSQKTWKYECKLLEKIDLKQVLSGVTIVKKYGALYKRKRIMRFIEVCNYRKDDCKTKVVKVFGITVLRYTKKAW